MAVCTWCNLEMLATVSCTVEEFHRNGEPVRRLPFGKRTKAARCSDCGAPRGGFHHPGCDQERCPQCRRQAMSCGCRFDEDPPDPDDESEDADTDCQADEEVHYWPIDAPSVRVDPTGITLLLPE